MAYVIGLYHELTEENRAPTLGTLNQVIDFILADPELSRGVSDWAQASRSMRLRPTPLHTLHPTASISGISAYLQSAMDQPVFTRPGQRPGDRR